MNEQAERKSDRSTPPRPAAAPGSSARRGVLWLPTVVAALWAGAIAVLATASAFWDEGAGGVEVAAAALGNFAVVWVAMLTAVLIVRFVQRRRRRGRGVSARAGRRSTS